MNTLRIAQVVIPRPLENRLSYLIPDTLDVMVGMRVLVPLGNKIVIGIIIELIEQEVGTSEFTLKPINNMLDTEALLDRGALHLLEWAARYYHHAVGEVVFHALPSGLRKPKMLSKRMLKYLSVHHAESAIQTESCIALTPIQQTCTDKIQHWLQESTHKPILLHGITGSGKTEIYLKLLTPLLQQGKQVLILVPEIGLTPQLIGRFTTQFPSVCLVCLHSGLSEGERLKAWLQARRGEAQIIIGTRSAVFTPAPALGCIIIDEEHDASFKQQEGFHYHGRDLALKRAQLLNVPLILGSATPSLESLYNAKIGRFHYVELLQRANTQPPPALLTQDTRPYALQFGLTPPSLEAIQQTLARGEQAMVFLNRRGFAPTLYCPSCGWHAACPHCSVNMTWHSRRNRLVCHQCTTEQATPLHCPQCSSTQLSTQGQGTERLELALQACFSETPVVRIDRDSIQTKDSLQTKLDTVRSNVPLILIGTQMLAKGHDFPNLTLVIIIDVDQALMSTDYRALERMGQLLIQVAGRAGRADKSGHVVLQTAQPNHPLLQQLLTQGYSAFAEQLLTMRERWHYPPFSYQALIRANSPISMEHALTWLDSCKQQLSDFNLLHIRLLDAIPAPIEKRASRYRAQLLVSCDKRVILHQALYLLRQHTPQLKGYTGLRWSIDIDPIDFS